MAKVALLARLRLAPDELETFTGQLNAIVGFVEQLRRARHRPTSSRWPTASRSATSSARTSAGPRSPARDALANAPKRNAESFLVPAVLE